MGKVILSLAIVLFIPAALGFSDPTQPRIKAPLIKKSISRSVNNPQPLTAIFIRGKQRYAIIDDHIYHLGEYYHGEKIIGISDDRVTLDSTNGSRQLTLFQKIKK